MNARLSLLAAAALSFAFCAPASAMTTTNYFCTISGGDSYSDNMAAATTAGWIINNTIANPDAKSSGVYSYPAKFKTGCLITSPTSQGGEYITEVILSAQVSSVSRAAEVTPQYEDESWGSTIIKQLSATGSQKDVLFSFDTSEKVVAFKIFFTVSGNSTAYLYYATIKSLHSLSTPGHLALDGDAGENGFSITWDAVADAEGYSVKAIGPNSSVVWSNDVATTSATISGLAPSTQYSVVVVALGDYDTTDDSVAATVSVTTDASSSTPTLTVSNKSSWTAGTAGTSAVSAMLEGDVSCTVESVSMSDGSTATVANGMLSWTPPFLSVDSTVTATFYVTHGSETWYLSEILSVAATPAPSAPVIDFDNVSSRSFDASWSATAGGPVVSYKLRAWTGRETPDNATGSANESFSTYRAGGPLPADWSPSASFSSAYASDPAPVKFDKSISLVSPVYPGTLTSLSFVVKQNGTATGSTFSVYGSNGEDGAEFGLIQSYDATTFSKNDEGTTLTLPVPAGVHQFKFEYVKSSANVGFGSFSVSGTDWPAADFLEGWGGAKVSVGTATSQTISNPVAGAVNWVEVTAVGPSGLETSARASISVPRVPAAVISVK